MSTIIPLFLSATNLASNTSSSLGVIGQIKSSWAFVPLAIALVFFGMSWLVEATKPYIALANPALAGAVPVAKGISIGLAWLCIATGTLMYMRYTPPAPVVVEEPKAVKVAEVVNKAVEVAGVATNQANEVYKGLDAGARRVVQTIVTVGICVLIFAIIKDGKGFIDSVKRGAAGLGGAGLGALIGAIAGPAGMAVGGAVGAGAVGAWYKCSWKLILAGICIIILAGCAYAYLGPLAPATGIFSQVAAAFWTEEVTLLGLATTKAMAWKAVTAAASVAGAVLGSLTTHGIYKKIRELMRGTHPPIH